MNLKYCNLVRKKSQSQKNKRERKSYIIILNQRKTKILSQGYFARESQSRLAKNQVAVVSVKQLLLETNSLYLEAQVLPYTVI